MQLHRLRLCLTDAPGRLGDAATALGALGVNIAGVDVQTVDGTRRIDELLVDLTVPVDLPAVEHALRAVGCEVEALCPADPHELTDGIARSLELAGCLVAGASGIGEVAGRLVRAERTWVGPAGDLPLHGAAARAFAEDSPAQAQEPVKRLPSPGRPTWCLAVPFATAAGRRVLVLVRRGHRFSFTETARVQALLRLVDGGTATAEALAGEHVLADGGRVTVRTIVEADAPALVRLHGRCSAESRYRRYFSPMPVLHDHVLRRLLDVDGRTTTGVVATCGSEVVGMGHGCRPSDRSAEVEVAFLVEDGHQQRGIGRLLLDVLVAQAARTGATEVVAETLPQNVALPRLLAHLGPTASRWEDGFVALRVPIPSAPALPSEVAPW